MTKNRKNDKIKIVYSILAIVVIYILLKIAIDGGILNRQYRSLIVPIGINIILAVSLNLTTGFLGELALGHAGFMAIGAYVGALITLNMNASVYVELPLALLAGGLSAALAGLIIGIPVLRLRGDYLAIVTLAFNQIIISIINSMKVTNGAQGLSKIETYTNYKHFTSAFILVVITIIVIRNFVHSKHGRAVCAVRDNMIAAEASGLQVSRYKILAFAIAAFFAGVAGVIYAHNVSIIKPTNFEYTKSIEILVMVVLGGMGSIKGSIIAAAALTVLPEFLRGADDFRMLLYATVLIVMMLFNQSGVRDRLLGKRKLLSNSKNVKGE
ncbi:branched-chain amino acid ABC transporter permease [Anaeromicropila populeti]|uniref:Branched-chain amino acid transport system permease protein n=1 Tax=Anaeromicropila populeti TaxID=37658 RepID=A0A1I6HKE2_9FIRM|nr:branched-chain amino acid ABC transporter permease [Anaeromicropila populeti]SFR54941.1 branched-chain amino acid transport system permease protein [Anaeromicropila populeti]